MKKIIIPITALFLALIISGCSSTPEELPDELVSADFSNSQTADISASHNNISELNIESDTGLTQAREKLISLGNGIASCNIDDNIEYNGGAMELPCTVMHNCDSSESFTEVSTGCLIAINGVLQKISCGKQKDEYMYVQTYENDDFVKENGLYVARKRITLSFEPQISENDKDLTKLQLTVITVDNPLFRLQPEYPAAFLLHRTGTSHVMTVTLNSPITSYTEDKISEDGFIELDYTDEVAKKYSTMVNINKKSLIENTAPFVNVDSDNYSRFCFDENRKLDLGFVTSVSEDNGFKCEISSQGRYLISMFVNGSPHAYPDGSMYKTVDMIPGKLYIYEAEDFSGILNEYDTIVFLPVACLRDDGKCIIGSSVQAHAILPEDKADFETPEH